MNTNLPAFLIGVWACGFVTILCRWLQRWVRIQADVRAASPLAIKIGIPVVSSPVLREPGVFGIFRPVLLLPEGIAEHLSKAEWEAILAHELCHARCYDNLTAAIYMLVETIFWFHPLVWWMGKRLVAERELACDEEVLRLGSEPKVYAEGILKVCELYLESPLECVAGVTGSNLRRRVRAIMTHRGTQRMNMGRKLVLTAAGVVTLAVPIVVGIMNAPRLQAESDQHATVPPKKFEVASIRPCGGGSAADGGRGGGARFSPERMSLNCQSVFGLIQAAYVLFANGHLNTRSVSIEGSPAWINSASYDIDAKSEGVASPDMMSGPMLQALLEDRFKLKVHRETREVPVYALTVAKSGLKLQQWQEGSCTPIDHMNPLPPPDFTKPPPPPPPKGTKPYCGGRWGRKGTNVTWDVQGTTLDELSDNLGVRLDRRIIDRTEVTGRFDFHLEFGPDQATPRLLAMSGDPDDPSGGPSIFAAVQQQLGLKLDPAKGPGEVLIIDHVERPTEN
jgi:bla regulator protein BlaR1